MKTKIEKMEDLKIELAEMGYSKKQLKKFSIGFLPK
jgi:hypothetical protein